MGGHRIFADSDHRYPQSGVIFPSVGKGAGLAGTSGGVVSWVKIKHNLFAGEIRQGDRMSVLIRQGEQRMLFPFLAALSSSFLTKNIGVFIGEFG